MTHTYLDCSTEVSSIQAVIDQPLCWLARDISNADYLLPTPADALEEILRLAEFLQHNPLPLFQRKLEELELPSCRALMAQMKFRLDYGVGFAVLDRLPMEQLPNATLVEVYWILGQCIGRPVAQKWDGQMVYEVRDTGAEYRYGTRGSHTAAELNFHTDNAFARRVPDYVGLLCRQVAKSGGVSRFCSLYSVHQRMLEQYPVELKRLYQPVFYDRQLEHRDGAAPISRAPYFSWRNGRLFARANATLIRQGYAVAEQTMDDVLIAALAAIDEVCAAADLWFEAPLHRGQIQYLNNHEIGHYRSAFEDFAEPERKRHLYRLWHRQDGSSSYDGCSLTDNRPAE